MTTVSTYLQMMDQLSRPLQRVLSGVQAAMEAMERFRRVVQAPVAVNVDAFKAEEALQRIAQQPESGSGFGAIQVKLDAKEAGRELSQMWSSLQAKPEAVAVQMEMDAASALQEAETTRSRIAGVLGPIAAAVQLDIPANLPAMQPQPGSAQTFIQRSAAEAPIPLSPVQAFIELNSAEAEKQWSDFRQFMQQQGLPPFTLTLDVENAAAEIDKVREKLKMGGLPAIELTINVQEAMQKAAVASKPMDNPMPAVVVPIVLDTSQALADAAGLPKLLLQTAGRLELCIGLNPLCMEQAGGRILALLQKTAPIVTPVVSFDPAAAYGQIQRTLNSISANSFTLAVMLDTDGVWPEIQRIKQRIDAMRALVIEVVLAKPDPMMMQPADQFRERVGIDVAFNARQSVRKAQMLKDLLQQQLGDIQARIRVELPASLNVMFANLQRMVMKLMAATRSMQNAAGQRQIARGITSPSRQTVSQPQNLMNDIQRQAVKVSVNFNARQAVRKAQMLRDLLQKQLGDIQARIRVELPASLNVMFANLQRLVLKLIAATRRLQNAVSQKQPAAQPQDQISDSQPKEGGSSKGLSLKGLADPLMRGIRAFMPASDSYMNIQTKLNAVNDGSQTTGDLQNKIFAAAQRSRTNYTELAGVIGKMSAAEAFGSNDETIVFAELLQKSFRLGGSSGAEQQAGMQQLSQAMMSGTLQGDDFRMMLENAPLLADAVAQFTGKSKSDLVEMFASGEIAADTFKGALFNAADEINSKFLSVPVTFEEAFNVIKTSAIQSFGPVFEKVNQWLSSSQGQQFIAFLTGGLAVLASLALEFVDALLWIGDVIGSLYSTTEPLIAMVGGALALWAFSQIPALIAKLWLMVQPILVSAAAFLTLNWPILLIGAAIGFLIYALYQWSDATVAAIGIVGGIFGVLFAYLFNVFASFANDVLAIAEFFINVWKDPMYALKKLFFDLFFDIVNNALDALDTLAKGIDSVLNKLGFNVNIADGLKNLQKKLTDAKDNLTSQEDVVSLMRFQQIGYEDAFQTGQQTGEKLGRGMTDGVHRAADKIKGFFGGNNDLFEIDPNPFKTEYTPMNIDKVGEVGKIGNAVDISSEDIKMMRELAEMKNIQNFVTLQPSINFGDTHVRQESDIDTIVVRITEKLEQDIATSADAAFY